MTRKDMLPLLKKNIESEKESAKKIREHQFKNEKEKFSYSNKGKPVPKKSAWNMRVY